MSARPLYKERLWEEVVLKPALEQYDILLELSNKMAEGNSKLDELEKAIAALEKAA